MGLLDFLQAGTLSGTVKHFVNTFYKYSTLTYENVGEHSKSDIFVAILYERHMASKQIGNSQYYDRLYNIDEFIDYVDNDFAYFIMFLLMMDSKSYRSAFKHDPDGYYTKISNLLIKNGYNNSNFKKRLGAYGINNYFDKTFRVY